MLVRDRNGRPTYTIRDTSEEGERQAFNFFAINMTTGMGLLSRYFGGGSVAQFGQLLRSRYMLRRRVFRDQYIQGRVDAGEDFDQEEEKKKFNVGKFEVQPVYRPGTFEEQLNSLQVITELQYDEPNVSEPRYTTVQDQLTLDRRQLKFVVRPETKTQPVRNIARNRIVEFIRSRILDRDVPKATVHGKDEHGRELPPVTISPEIDSYAKYPYNDVVVAENMPADDIASSPFVTEILRIARANGGIFETRIQ